MVRDATLVGSNEVRPDLEREQLLELHREIRPQLALAALGALLVGGAYLLLPESLTVGPNWLVLAIEAVVLFPLTSAAFFRPMPHQIARGVRTGLQVSLTLALLSSLVLLIAGLSTFQRGTQLLRPAALLWLSNILIFAVWYWEIDGGGPARRHLRGHQMGDFLFPYYTIQSQSPVLPAPLPAPTSTTNHEQGHTKGPRR